MLAPARRGPAPARELQSPDPYSPAPILPPVPPLPLPPPPPPAAVQAQPVGLPLQPLLHAAASRSVSPPPPPPLPAPQDRLQSPPRCVAVGGGRHNPPRAAALAGADEPPRRRSEQDPHGEGGAPAAPSGSEAESGDLKAQLTEAAGRLADSESELELERGLVERYAAAHAGARRQAEELRRERDLLAEQCRQLAAQHKLLSEDVHNAESAAAAARAELAGVVGTLRRARSAGLQRVGSRRSCAATVQAEDDGAPQHLLHEAGSAAQLGHSCRAPAAADATAPLHLLQRGELARRGSLGRRASLLPREAAHRRGSVYSTAPPASEVDEIRAIPSILEPDGLDRGTSAAALRSRSVAESGVSAAALAEGCAASSSFLSAPAVHRGASSPSMRQHSVAECGASVSALAADQAVSASFLSAPMMHRGTSAAARGTSSPSLQRHAVECGTSCSALAAVDRGTSSLTQRHAAECGTSCSALGCGVDRGVSAAELPRGVDRAASAAPFGSMISRGASALGAVRIERGTSAAALRQAERGTSCMQPQGAERGTSCSALAAVDRGTSSPALQRHAADCGTSCSALAAVDRGTSSPSLQRHAVECGTSCSALAAVDRGTSSPTLQRHAVECGTSCSAMSAVDRGTSSPTLHRHAAERGASVSPQGGADDSSQTLERVRTQPTALGTTLRDREAAVYAEANALLAEAEVHLERLRREQSEALAAARQRVESLASRPEAESSLVAAEEHLRGLEREQTERLAAAEATVRSLRNADYLERGAEDRARGDFEAMRRDVLTGRGRPGDELADAAACSGVRHKLLSAGLRCGPGSQCRGAAPRRGPRRERRPLRQHDKPRRECAGGRAHRAGHERRGARLCHDAEPGGAFGTRTCSAYAGSSSRRSSWETRGAVASSALRPWNSPEPRDAAELPNRGCHPTVPQFEADEMKGLPAPWPPPRSLSCCAGGGHRLPSAAAPSGSGHDASDDAVSSSGHPEPLAGAGELLAEAQAVERELQLAQEDAAEAAAEADALRVRCAELAALAQRLQQELRDSEQAREELKEALGRAEAEAAAERQRRADDTQKAELWRDHLEAKLRGAEKMRDNEALRRGELEEAIYAVPDTGGGARQERPARGGVGRPPFYPPGRSPPRQGRTSASPPGRHPVSPPPARSLSPQSPRPRRPLRSLSAAPPSPPRWRAPWEKHAQYAGGPLSPPPAASRRRRTVSPPRPPLMHALPVRQRRQRRAGGMPRHRRAEGAARGLADTAWHSAAAAMAAASVPVGDSRRISPRRRAPS
eukprot:TRINITY_DN421_c0_g1_i5.p1 TRINITY_DN421_c0_g1~~TRINITY_DN421_c0_g1_i5.p1  ORF type:complete len:1282 (+),score=133.21 TRINITY_DN421_c0_g1_i5:97-3942(+)